MEKRSRDVDEVILSQARRMLPGVQINGHAHHRVDSVDDIPLFIVLVFELLSAENIPPEMKPFSTLTSRAQTIQRIIDTLEESLRLPMSHVTGMGVAKLDRRHISDLLQILEDLYQHCFPGHQPGSTHSNEVANTSFEDRRLTVSQLQTPGQTTSTPCLSGQNLPPHLSKLMTDILEARQNHDRKRPGRNPVPDYIQMVPEPVRRQGRVKKTCAAENKRLCKDAQTSVDSDVFVAVRIHKADEKSAKSSVHEKQTQTSASTAHKPLRDRHRPGVDKDINDDAHIQPKQETRKVSVREERYAPYGRPATRPVANENADTRGVKIAKDKYKKPSFVRRPRVKSFKNASNSPIVVVGDDNKTNNVKPLRENNKNRNVKHTSAFAVKHDIVPSRKQENTLLKNALSPIRRQPVRRCSARRAPPTPTKPLVRKASTRSLGPQQRYIERRAPNGRDSKRRPSVVSTKARKHSDGGHWSPNNPNDLGNRSPVRRGCVSPQTTSLCCSLRLLKDLDYIYRRMKKISQQKQIHLEAIRELKEEEKRLQHVLSHVQGQAKMSLRTVTQSPLE